MPIQAAFPQHGQLRKCLSSQLFQSCAPELWSRAHEAALCWRASVSWSGPLDSLLLRGSFVWRRTQILLSRTVLAQSVGVRSPRSLRAGSKSEATFSYTTADTYAPLEDNFCSSSRRWGTPTRVYTAFSARPDREHVRLGESMPLAPGKGDCGMKVSWPGHDLRAHSTDFSACRSALPSGWSDCMSAHREAGDGRPLFKSASVTSAAKGVA